LNNLVQTGYHATKTNQIGTQKTQKGEKPQPRSRETTAGSLLTRHRPARPHPTHRPPRPPPPAPPGPRTQPKTEEPAPGPRPGEPRPRPGAPPPRPSQCPRHEVALLYLSRVTPPFPREGEGMSLSQEFSARMVPRTLLDNANEDIARLRQQLSSVLAEGCRGDADKEIRNLQTQVAPAPMAM